MASVAGSPVGSVEHGGGFGVFAAGVVPGASESSSAVASPGTSDTTADGAGGSGYGVYQSIECDIRHLLSPILLLLGCCWLYPGLCGRKDHLLARKGFAYGAPPNFDTLATPTWSE